MHENVGSFTEGGFYIQGVPKMQARVPHTTRRKTRLQTLRFLRYSSPPFPPVHPTSIL